MRGLLRRSAALPRRPGAWTGAGSSAREEARGLVSVAIIYLVSEASLLPLIVVFACHMAFSNDDYPLLARLLISIPGLLLIIEGRRYVRREGHDLPVIAIGLSQFYVTFCFPVFFDLEFFDLGGPVHFSSAARMSGSMAVAAGGLFLLLGGHLGRKLGGLLQGPLVRSLPPEETPAGWDGAVLAYCVAAIAFSLAWMLVPRAIPAAISMPLGLSLSVEIALGLTMAKPLSMQNVIARRAPMILTFAGALLGLMRGFLDPMFRMIMCYTAGRWAYQRRFALRFIAGLFAAYFLLQPVKAGVRAQLNQGGSQAGTEIGYVDRLRAWGDAFQAVWTGEKSDAADRVNPAVERLGELGAVMHAFDVVPQRVQYLDGSGFSHVLYSPIPRFIWPDKPTTRDTVQRYAVVFGRQTERGAETTAINLPLLVEGYWNFGWPGVLGVCMAMGLWLGAVQGATAGRHWALRVIGIGHIFRISVGGSLALIYASIFQNLVAFGFVCWLVYWLAKALSTRVRHKSPLLARALPVRRLGRG